MSGRAETSVYEITKTLEKFGLEGQQLEDKVKEIAHNMNENPDITVHEIAELNAPSTSIPEEPSLMDVSAAEMAQELAAMENVSHADLEQMVYNDGWFADHDKMVSKVEAEILEMKPDFQFAEMSVEDQIVMAFIENDGTLSQQDIELIISEAGIDGAEFQATFDDMIAKYSNHQDFNIDPPVASVADKYAPNERDIAAAEPTPTQTPNEPEPKEQEYAQTNTTQNPALPM
jgi:hypothetical protein